MIYTYKELTYKEIYSYYVEIQNKSLELLALTHPNDSQFEYNKLLLKHAGNTLQDLREELIRRSKLN